MVGIIGQQSPRVIKDSPGFLEPDSMLEPVLPALSFLHSNLGVARQYLDKCYMAMVLRLCRDVRVWWSYSLRKR
jgi:hypothetical protein